MCDVENHLTSNFTAEKKIELFEDLESLLQKEGLKISGISSEEYIQTLKSEKKIPTIAKLIGKQITLLCKNEIVNKEVPFEPPKASHVPLSCVVRIDGVLSCLSRDGLVLQNARGFRKIQLKCDNSPKNHVYLDPVEIGGIVVSPLWIGKVFIRPEIQKDTQIKNKE